MYLYVHVCGIESAGMGEEVVVFGFSKLYS